METCKKCKFFLPGGDEQGICRRFPPTPIVTVEGIFFNFPSMLNEGWCGEHKPRDTEQ